MQAAGITHLNIDILGSDTFNHCLEWIQAAHAEGWRNRVILTPDCNASIVRNGPANLAGFLKQAYTGAYSAALRKWRDGRWLTMPYSPETALGQTPTAFTDAQLTKYWTDWSAAMVAQGTPAVMWCCFQRAWRDPAQHTTNLASPSSGVFNGPALSSIVVGLGRWNPRNPDEADSTSIDNGGAPALSRTAAPTGYGLPFLYTQAVEDERPDQSKFEECRGWDNLVSWWEMVLRTGTEAVQIATWNDRRENTGIEPSKYHGYADLDVMSYYACRYVLGYDPPLIRDALYLAHRVQHPPAFTPQPTYTAGAAYTKRMVKAGTTAEWSQVDVLVFAKAPAEVSVTIAGVARTVTYGTTTGTSVSVPAGISRVQAPMASGAVVATLKRAGAVVPGGTVTSPFPINLTSQLVQDLTYRRTSSLR